MARVIAAARGHDGRQVREPGEEFDLDLADKRFEGCDWFVPVEKAESKPPAGKVKKPDTSDIA